MNKNSIYAENKIEGIDETRFIRIKVKNTFGIVNRVSSLFRKRRFFMKEFSVNLNNDDTAEIMVVIDGKLFDINQIINQIEKIYDVVNVEDVTEKKEKLYYVYFIDFIKKDILILDKKPNITLKNGKKYKQIYYINIKEKNDFQSFLEKNGYNYKERLATIF